jgi:hypothetical protein
MIGRALLALPSLLALAGPAEADVTGCYIEYRHIPELGQILITARWAPAERLVRSAAGLEGRDLLVCEGDRPKTHERVATEAGHVVRSVVTIYPPLGHGMGGALHTAALQVIIDGKKKVDCTIGSRVPADLEVSSIGVQADEGYVFVQASVHGQVTGVPTEYTFLKYPDVLTDDAILAAYRRSKRP